jgi:alkanesulfonate monooxygenase SsuD/methylene tetrahydromethanopterin reductase-like flavin-dependent oxidoreductase (luciferase family)
MPLDRRPLSFGIGLPTCREGVLYRPGAGFGTIDGIDRLALAAEANGFSAVWVDDHLVDRPSPDGGPPSSLLEAMMILSHLAGTTSRVVLGASVIALPLREPVLFARQIIALDHISAGRALIGVGIGNRDELVTVRPAETKMHRWNSSMDRLALIRRLLDDGRASSDLPFNQFGHLEMHPGPIQRPMPIHIATGVAANLPEVVANADGWHSLGLALDKFAANVEVVRRQLSKSGKPHGQFDILPSFHLRIADDAQSAYAEALSSAAALPWADNVDHPANLFGTPAEIAAKLHGYIRAGATGCIISVLAATVDDAEVQIKRFAAEVMPMAATASRG